MPPPPATPPPPPDDPADRTVHVGAGSPLDSNDPAWPQFRELLDLLDSARRNAPRPSDVPPTAGRPARTPTGSVASIFQPGGRIGRYELVRELGRGGMGLVYLARDPGLDRLVAVKVLHPSVAAAATAPARFRTEGLALARLRHPNVVQVFETGTDGDTPFLAMEFVDGPTLHAHLNARPLPPREAATVLEAVARGVDHAHAQGVIHRDLKPANILLAGSRIEDRGPGKDGVPLDPRPSTLDPVPKVTDFGLAGYLNAEVASLTHTGELVGTPNYVAPEMVAGDDSGGPTAVDVYGLGAVLYQTLTGRPPFVGTNLAMLLMQVRFDDPPPPRQLNPDVPGDLETVCLTCLRKEPGRRYPTAAALADDLRRFLDGRPIRARPAGRVERGVKWVRRNPALAAAAAAVAVGAVVVIAVLWASAVRLGAERDRAVKGEGDATAAKDEAQRRAVALTVGLARMAEAEDDLPLAALRFATAAQQCAKTDPAEAALLRQCWQTYTAAGPVPVAAAQLPGGLPLRVLLHPSGRWLFALDPTNGWTCWDFDAGRRLPLPTPPGRFLTGVDLTPDGRRMAVTDGCLVCVYPFPTPADAAPLHEWPAPANCVRVGFDIAGRRLFAFGDGPRPEEAHKFGNGVRVWDLAAPAAAPLDLPLADRVGGAAFSARGDLLAAVTRENTAFAFRVGPGADGTPVLGPVPSICAERTGQWENVPGVLGEQYLVTATGEKVEVYDLNTKRAAYGTLGDEAKNTSAAVDPAGRQFVIRHDNRPPDLFTAALPRPVALPTDGGAREVVFAPGGGRMLLRLRNGVHLWDAVGLPVGSPVRHPNRGLRMAVGGGGGAFATVTGDGLARVWRAPAAPARATVPWPGDDFPAAFAVAADLVVTHTRAGDRPAAVVLRGSTGRPAGPPYPLSGRPVGMAVRPDGAVAYAVVPSDAPKGQLHAWRPAGGDPPFAAVPLPFKPGGVALSPDGKTLVLVGAGGIVLGLDAATGTARFVGPTEGNWSGAFPHDRVRFSADGRFVATFGFANQLRVWAVADGTLVRTLSHASRVIDAQFAPDGRTLASLDLGGLVQLWETSGWTMLRTLPHAETVYAMRFAPGGDRLLTGCRDGKVRVWDPADGTELVPPLPHRAEVTSLAVSPDGAVLATADGQGNVRLWSAATGRPLTPPWRRAEYAPPVPFAHHIRFDPDGRTLYVGVCNQGLQVLDLSVALTPPPGDLTADDMIRQAERTAGATIRPDGTVETLSSADWLARWK